MGSQSGSRALSAAGMSIANTTFEKGTAREALEREKNFIQQPVQIYLDQPIQGKKNKIDGDLGVSLLSD